MILVRVLKDFQFQAIKYEVGKIIGFDETDKYDLQNLAANDYIEIIEKKNGEAQIQIKKVEDADFQSQIYQLLLTKDKDTATELLVEKLKEKTRFYATRFDEKNEVYYYNSGIYLPEGRSLIREYCRKILANAYSEQLANRVCAKIEADSYITQQDFLKRHYPNLVACQNGILNLEDSTISPFTSEKIFLAKLPIAFEPSADCPAIKKFLQEVLPSKEDAETMFEIFGYCLSGGYPIQKIILLVGEGANGKGQMLELLRTFLGEGNYSSIPLQQLQNNDFKEIELFNKMANIGADISDEPLKQTAKIKGLSGGDAHNASVKFKQDLTFVNEAKMIFSANKLPKTYDLSFAFFRRWVYLVFPYTFVGSEEQGTLTEEKLKIVKVKMQDVVKKIVTPEELSGLLNCALAGLKRIKQKGGFTISQSNDETRKWWVRNSDSFLAFCWENVEEKDGWVGKEELRKRYQLYCRVNRCVAEGDRHIHEVLTREMHAWTEQDGEGGQRVWNGIQLRNISQ